MIMPGSDSVLWLGEDAKSTCASGWRAKVTDALKRMASFELHAEGCSSTRPRFTDTRKVFLVQIVWAMLSK